MQKTNFTLCPQDGGEKLGSCTDVTQEERHEEEPTDNKQGGQKQTRGEKTGRAAKRHKQKQTLSRRTLSLPEGMATERAPSKKTRSEAQSQGTPRSATSPPAGRNGHRQEAPGKPKKAREQSGAKKKPGHQPSRQPLSLPEGMAIDQRGNPGKKEERSKNRKRKEKEGARRGTAETGGQQGQTRDGDRGRNGEESAVEQDGELIVHQDSYAWVKASYARPDGRAAKDFWCQL